jgi:hypothetical protein
LPHGQAKTAPKSFLVLFFKKEVFLTPSGRVLPPSRLGVLRCYFFGAKLK